MLVKIGKKHKPPLKPEVMIEELIEKSFRELR